MNIFNAKMRIFFVKYNIIVLFECTIKYLIMVISSTQTF